MLKLLILSFFIVSCSSTKHNKIETRPLLTKRHKKVIYDAIVKENENALQAIVVMLPAEDRSSKDQGVINNALAMTLAKGQACNNRIAKYLWNAGARVSFTTVKNFSQKAGAHRRVYLMPLCGSNYISKSYYDFMKTTEDHPERVKVQDYLTQKFVSKSHNNFLQFVSSVFPKVNKNNERFIIKDLNRYTKLIVKSLKEGKDFCKKNRKSSACISVFLYHKTIEDLKVRIDASKAKKLEKSWFKSLATIEQVYKL